MDGRQAVVRSGYLPSRDILTGIGPVAVQVPKIRDRTGTGITLTSALAPPYVRRTPRVSSALPWLYLKGVSSGDLGEARRFRDRPRVPRGFEGNIQAVRLTPLRRGRARGQHRRVP